MVDGRSAKRDYWFLRRGCHCIAGAGEEDCTGASAVGEEERVTMLEGRLLVFTEKCCWRRERVDFHWFFKGRELLLECGTERATNVVLSVSRKRKNGDGYGDCGRVAVVMVQFYTVLISPVFCKFAPLVLSFVHTIYR